LLFNDAEHVVFAHDQVLIAVDFHLGAGILAEQDPVAFFRSSAMGFPSSPTLPFPTAITLPSAGFSLAVSGMMMPPWWWSLLRRAAPEFDPAMV
jgi:hypothetical protein